LASTVKAETAGVKAPTLVEVRAQLTTYDLTADGTTKVLARLSELAREHAGDQAGEEARFLHLAVGADLSFIADFTGDTALRARVAETFGVAPDALHEQLARGLGALAHGIYEQPAKLALRSGDRAGLERARSALGRVVSAAHARRRAGAGLAGAAGRVGARALSRRCQLQGAVRRLRPERASRAVVGPAAAGRG
jgi:hypothetical protein